MKFGEKLRELMDKKPKIKGKDLAEKAGISPQLITEIRGCRKLPSYKNLNSILENLTLLDSEKEELLEYWKMDKDSNYISLKVPYEKVENENKKILEKKKVEKNEIGEVVSLYVVGKVSAGYGYLNFNDLSEKKNYYGLSGKSYRDCFVVSVVGDSMEPKILEDFELIVNPKIREIEENINKIVVASLNGETYVKTLRKINNKLFLESSNKKYRDIEIKKSDDFYIIGKVIESRYEKEY